MSGWYKQQRNLSERPWYKDSCMVHLYHYLKEMAYVVDGTYEGVIIRRGSCPTTRSEMSEMTGMSLRTLDRVLRRLISYGEIIVRGNSRFSIITICDYDSFKQDETLFGTTDGISNGTTDGISNGTTDGTTHISTIEERYKDNLISHNIPYKKEKERQDVVLEIKKRYNKTFDGKLPPCIRLHEPTRRMVETCISRFGLQSVDLVFEQLLAEPFSLGQNKTGFIANFQFVFEPKNFQQYLERAQLAKKRGAAKQASGSVGVFEVPDPQPQPQKTEEEKQEDMKERYVCLVRMFTENPNSIAKGPLTEAYNNGTLAKLGIDWKPQYQQQ